MNASVKQLWSRGLSAKSLRWKAVGNRVYPEKPIAFGDLYRLNGHIGSGTFGQIFDVTHKHTNTRVVMKAVKRTEWYANTFDKVDDIYHQVLGWDNENLVKYHDALQLSFGLYAVFMESLKGPEMRDRIALERNMETYPRFLQFVMSEMLKSLVFIHKEGLIHRDVKLESFKFRDDKPGAMPVLFDLGLCCRIDSTIPRDRGSRWGHIVGTMQYLSPEMVYSGQYDEKIDVWSIGVCLYVMLTGHFPWSPAVKLVENDISKLSIRKESEIFCDNIADNFLKEDDLESLWNRVLAPSNTISFLKKMMAFNPADRLNANEAYELACQDHTWR